MVLTLSGFVGCETARRTYYLPYELPPAPPAVSSPQRLPSAAIRHVTDVRSDHTLDMFLSEYPADFLRKALAAELVAQQAFASCALKPETAPPGALLIDATLKEVTWATPGTDGVARTQFGVTLATGLAGALVYGATSTPAYSRVLLDVTVTDPATGRIVLSQPFESLHEEKIAKLQLDSLETRARILATSIKSNLMAVAEKLRAMPATP